MQPYAVWWPIRQVPRTAAWTRTKLKPMALISFSSSNAWCMTNIWHILVTAGLMNMLQQSSNMAGWSIYVHLFTGVVPPRTLPLWTRHEMIQHLTWFMFMTSSFTPNLDRGTRATTHTNTHVHNTLPYKRGLKHPARSSNLFALTTPSWQFQCRHLLRMYYIYILHINKMSMTSCSCWVQAPSLRSWQGYQRLRPVTLVEHLSLARISSFLGGNREIGLSCSTCVAHDRGHDRWFISLILCIRPSPK